MNTFTAFVLAASVVALATASLPPSFFQQPAKSCDPKCNPCTPKVDPATVIEPVPGNRATVEIVPAYGSCPVTYRGYRWHVSWGDGVSSVKVS